MAVEAARRPRDARVITSVSEDERDLYYQRCRRVHHTTYAEVLRQFVLSEVEAERRDMVAQGKDA